MSEASNTKIAPGMEVSYYIKFTPEAKVDVYYELIVITEREKFVVPIRGIGCKVKLEFMDMIDFGEVPVKYKVEKPIIVRNVGEKITKWMLKSSSQNITVNKKEGILDVGKSEQIICTFCPLTEGFYEETMVLSYDDENSKIRIFGKAKNDNVSLSSNEIALEDAYITLHSQMPIYIRNDTSVPIEFVWKQYPSKEREDEEKRRVFDNLNRQEAEEKILNELQYDYHEVEGDENSSVDLDDSYDEEERVKILERHHMKSQNIIARRFEKIKKSLNEDQMCYENPYFQIEPISGKIWPNAKMTITVTFKPDKAKREMSEAYCDVTGLDKRLKLSMSGLGIGPKAKLSFSEYNLYDVPIKSQIPLPQKLVISNVGVIDCEFVIKPPNTPCGKQFHFNSYSGKLRPRGEKETGELAIPIDFHAERLGEFSEKFIVHILKSGADLPLIFKGHVIAPFCKFSRERIDFEKVSLGLDKKESVDLYNGSEVDIKYKLRISTDAKDLNTISTIFIIDRTEGVLGAGETTRINIAFKPEDERSYEIVLLLDMIDIGFDMLTLPITAVCEIPEVIIEPSEVLDFGEVYIREEKWLTIKLTNTSSTLTALFQVNPQDEPSKTWGLLFFETESGQIAPEGTFNLNIGLKALRLQKIPLKLEIRCKTKNSSRDSSYITTINVIAYSIGPKVIVENEIQEVDFNTVKVLKEDIKSITLINTCPIDAVYTAFMKNTNSIFSIREKSGKISKKSSVKVDIICRPDEATRFNEYLYFKIDEGRDFEILLKCKGEGTTIIIPNEDIKEINFGTIFTSKEFVKEIRFENRGRSDQIIAWYPVKQKKPKILSQEPTKNKKALPEEEEKTFVIETVKGRTENRGKINSRKFGFFRVVAFSKVVGQLSEAFAIHNWRDGENNGPKVWDCVVTANFINPQLTARPHKLPFTYSYEKGKMDDDSVKNVLTIKNSAKLQAEFEVVVPAPFKVNKNNFIIDPENEEQLIVEFDPTVNKQNRKIDKFTRKLEFHHTNHEQIDVVDLVVSINFPNLKELPTELNFGSLLNDTYTKKTITLESDSEIEVIYEWSLIEVENSYEPVRKEGKDRRRKIPLNEVFSIVPMNGRLRKGETETVEVTFTPGSNQRYSVVARCSVEGGPEYDVRLTGEASDIRYKILINDGSEPYDMTKKDIVVKLGEIPFNVTSKVDMTIKNDGEVPFSYRINYNTDKMRYLNISNVLGNVTKGESKKEFIEIIPGIPDFVDDEIIVEIAHFEPIKIRIKAIGVYQGILVMLNRKEQEFLEQIEEAKISLEERNKKMFEYKALEPKLASVVTKKGEKATEIRKTMIPLQAQWELEVNRQNLCKKLIEKMSKNEIMGILGGNPVPIKKEKANNPSFSATRESQLAAMMKEIKIATYSLDFGNIVANRKIDLKFEIYNYNKVTSSFSIDKREMSNMGYILMTNSNNDRHFIEPGSSMVINISHETNTRNLNQIRNFLKMLMKDGETFEIELNSFVTIPDLRLSLVSPLEFGRVYIGRKKVMRFRVENFTRVPTRWSIVLKESPNKQSDREERKEEREAFTVNPQSGKLDPGKRQTLTVTFAPNKEKTYTNKYNFIVEEGSKPIEFFIKGDGQKLSLKIIPDVLDIGPVLPYFKYAYNFIELYNPNDEDIEVYSTDFDSLYLKEEDIIKYYRAFLKNPQAGIDLPIRNCGAAIWNKLESFNKRWLEKVEMLKLSQGIDPNDEKALQLFNERLINLDFEEIEEEDEFKNPPAIDLLEKYNVIMLGPEKCGRSSISKEQRSHQLRGIVSIANILQWNDENGFHELANKARIYLEEKKKELENLKIEREKLLKQAKTNKKIKVDETPIDEKKYLYLSNDIMVELLQNRLKQPDCNVGAVFEDFHSDLIENEETLLEIVDEALNHENLILAYFDFPEDPYGQEVCKFVDWGKYHMEHHHKLHKKNEKNKEHPIKKPVVVTRKNQKEKDSNINPSGSNQNINTLSGSSFARGDKKNSGGGGTGKDKNDSHYTFNQTPSSTHLDIKVNPINELQFSTPKNWSPEEKIHYKQIRDTLIAKMTEIKEKREIMILQQEQEKLESINSNNSMPAQARDQNLNFLNIQPQNEISSKPQSSTNLIIVQPEPTPRRFVYKVERKSQRIEYEYHLAALLESYLKVIPSPKLPDPEDLPLPPDEEYQIVRRPNPRPERKKIELFSIKSIHPNYENCTMEELVNYLIEEDKHLEEQKLKDAQGGKDKNKKPAGGSKPPGKDTKTNFLEEYKPKEILINKNRWKIKRGEKERIIVKFFSSEVGKKMQNLGFEIMTYPPIESNLQLNGIADYPSLSTLPSNIKMNLPGTIGLLNRKKNYDENFGSILITKGGRENLDKYKDTNCKLLRFTNNGKFDLRVDFSFLSSLNFEGLGFPLPFNFSSGADMNSSASMAKGKKDANQINEPATPFMLVNNFLEIKKEQTEILKVFAFPGRTVDYKDELICLIKDNPIPIRINLSCKGTEPRVDLETDTLEFEKLIVNQPLTKHLRLKNNSDVTCKWTLNGLNNIPPQFKFEATSGTIEKNKELLINVTFCSEKQEKFNFILTLDIEDNMGYGVKMPTRNIKFLAEAFSVNVDLNLKDKLINFGDVKVRDYKKFPFSLKNLGIYKIKYKFEIGKKLWQELFKFEPAEGEIEPGKEKNLLAIFLPYPKDINISQSKGTEIKLIIYEGEKNIKNDEIPIFVNVSSYFSKYTINPPKTINFGSMQYGESQTRSIEIRNEGTFDFNYEVMEFTDEPKMKKLKEEKDAKELEEQKIKEQEMRDELENMSGKGGKPGGAKKPAAQPQKGGKDPKKGEDFLKVGKFSLTNFRGTVAPGSTAKIDVKFDAEGNKFYQSTIAIDIQGRHPDDNPLGIPFELGAESCIPGIETKDFDAIFEEQTVLPSLNPEINRQNAITSGIYAVEEKVFWFGTIIASKNPNGVTERFKLINNNKIPCTIKVEVKPRTVSKSEAFSFEVAHKTPLKIYPNESEYVSVTFKPANVIPYSAIFEAKVEGGELNPDTGKLTFELRGEGTLPTVLLQSPQEFDNDGTPLLKFKKTRLSKTSTAKLEVKNWGVVPATVKLEPFNHDCFSVLSNSTTVATIQPKEYYNFEFMYEPKAERADKVLIQYKTLYNPYEIQKIYLMGEGYFEPISIEGLVNDIDLMFGDVCIGTTKQVQFTISNHSEVPYRFNWLNNYEPSLDITPSVGFLLPKTTKTITATFCSKESIKIQSSNLYVELKQVKLNNNEDWDNSMKIIKKVSLSEYNNIIAKKQEEAQKRKDEIEILVNTLMGGKGGKTNPPAAKKDQNQNAPKKKEDGLLSRPNEENIMEVEINLPEPNYSIIEKSEKFNTIRVTAVADYVKFQCQVKEIKFKPTTMYGSRKHEFQLRNISSINMHYNFTIINPSPYINNSSMVNLSNPMYVSSDNQDDAPFSVFPKSGVLPPNNDEIIRVRFSPTEVDDTNFRRIMTCHIKDLDPSLKDLQIDLSGDAERPMCHFELQEGIKQENGNTLVEFESIGMMVRNTKRFFVLNPTNQGYEFEWEQQDEEIMPSINKVFKCLTPKGVIYSGKKFEMVFEYTPNNLGTHQSFWTFRINTGIENEKLSHKFIFNGIAREPVILFNVGKINFGPLLLGGRNKEVIEIINEEHLPYKFIFDKESIKGNNTYGDSLIVSPIAGTLQPKSSTQIEVTFMPRVEKEFNYNLVLKVKQRLKPLTLNVKGVGYTINHCVYLDSKQDLRLIPKQEHVIDFGEFFINEKRERKIIIENNGNFNFHFLCKKNGADYLTLSPDSGTVKKKKEFITLTLLPLNKLNLINHKIFLQIVSGPTYTFLLNAKARSPQIVFSSVSCNFGPCYVMRQPVPNTQIITVKNMDKEALTIETNFDNKNKPYLDVLLSTGQVILPFSTPTDILEIPIVFIPRDFTKYRDIIKFKFNGIYDVDVEIIGEGIPLRVELEDPAMQNLNFGIIQLGQSKKMEFVVVNRGKIKVNVQLYAENQASFAKKCLESDVSPEEVFTLEPRGNLRVGVEFNPNIRIPAFQEDIMMKVNNSDVKRLITVSGASYGVDVKIVGDLPPFGTVVVNSMAMRQIILRNTGDLPAKFKWESPNPKKDYSKFFTFSPNSGSIPPHEDFPVEIIFHPKVVENSIAFEKIKCYVENTSEPLMITLYGKSIAVPNESITQNKIITEVRSPKTSEIKIKNTTDKVWRITPSISTSEEQYVSYFKGDHLFEIKPGQEGVYTVTYHPLTMSKHPNSSVEKEHEATVFFPLPDGTARVHKIIGVANQPIPKTINKTVVARQWIPLVLDVHNWLFQTQRFKVSWITDKTDPGIFIKGANTIDVAADSIKEYKLSFRSWKEIQCGITITFENVDTKEYLYYNINMNVTPAESNPVTELAGVTREIVTSLITITNPLKIPVVINSSQITCDNEYVSIKLNTPKILPESEMPIEVSFRPLTVGHAQANIFIKSTELGDMKYPLLLKGTNNPQPKSLQPIQAYLGSEKIVTVSFTNYLKKPTTYNLKVDKLVDNMPVPVDFVPESAVVQSDPSKSTEVTFTIKFEPYQVGRSMALLKATSPEGGEYSWVLIGEAYPPQAQGPYKIPAGKAFTLDFKNPMNEAVEVIARFDNQNFSTTLKGNTRVDAKKPLQIPISYKAGTDLANTGRLIVTLNSLNPNLQNKVIATWVFYLAAE
jgi:hydrocephalus-inducing protein